MSIKITATVASTMIDAGIGTLANNAKLRVYDGVRPATAGTAIVSQVKLLEFILPADAFPAASAGVLTANPIPTAMALATSTATWYRLLKSDGTTVLADGSVGIMGSGADLIIDTAAVTIADVVAALSFVLAQTLG